MEASGLQAESTQYMYKEMAKCQCDLKLSQNISTYVVIIWKLVCSRHPHVKLRLVAK